MRVTRSSSLLSVLLLAACSDDGSPAGSASASESGTGSATDASSSSSSSGATEDPPTTSASGSGGGVCTPGQVQECMCDGAGLGEQVCEDSGDGFGPCVCPDAVCGDGEVDEGEACDDGVNDGAYDGCAVDCTALGPHCGDAAINGPEACDDGDDVDGDGCNVNCVLSGSEVWTVGYAGEDAGNARARGVAVDGAGNVIIVGEEFVVGQNANIWARKYTPDGDVLWTYTWVGADNGDDVAHAVAVGDDDDLFIVGETYESLEGANIWIAALDAGMQEKWLTTHNGPGNLGDRAFGVAVDPSGDIVVTGEEYKLIGLHNAWTRRLDKDGNPLWTDVFDANAGNDSGRAAAIAPNGDIVVAGNIYVPIGLADLWLRRYSADGDVLWSRSADHMKGNDRAHAVAIAGDGTIAVVGEVYEPAGLSAIHVSKWSEDGMMTWSQVQDSEGGDNDIGHGVAWGPGGELVAVGEEYTANDFARVWVRKYDAENTELWTQIFDGDAAGNDVAWAVAVAPDGHVYAAGEEYEVGQFATVWLRKYAP